jgi:glutathione S-transferase
VLIPARLGQLEAILASNNQNAFSFGQQPTIADIELYTTVRGIQDGSLCQALQPSVIDETKFPRLLAVVTAIERELQTRET